MRLLPLVFAVRLGLIALGIFVLFLAEMACWIFASPVDKGFPNGLFVKRSHVGYTGSPGLSVRVERIYPHNVSINSEGFRDDEWGMYQNERRILMVGSSALFGLGVEKKDRISERVASRLNITVQNAGMYGYGSPQALWALRELCKRRDYSMAVYVHEYKLSRNDFVRNPARTVEDGVLVTLPHAVGSGANLVPLKSAWIAERLQMRAFRAFLANHDLAPRQIYEALRGLESFNEQYFSERYAFTSDQHSFSTSNVIKVAENIRAMQESAAKCGAKFVVVLLPGPMENRFRKNEPSTKKLLEILKGVSIIDLRHVLPMDAKLLLPGLDYFNPMTLDALAGYLTVSVVDILKSH